MSRPFASIALIAGLALGGGAVLGQSEPPPRLWMQEGEIRAELTNVKLAGIYPTKVTWAELVRPDGTTDYEEGNQRRPGRWDVKGELYCFVYALEHQGGCFRVVRHSRNCYELYTASIGGIAPATPPPASAMSWNGQMWREAEPATCNEKQIS